MRECRPRLLPQPCTHDSIRAGTQILQNAFWRLCIMGLVGTKKDGMVVLIEGRYYLVAGRAALSAGLCRYARRVPKVHEDGAGLA